MSIQDWNNRPLRHDWDARPSRSVACDLATITGSPSACHATFGPDGAILSLDAWGASGSNSPYPSLHSSDAWAQALHSQDSIILNRAPSDAGNLLLVPLLSDGAVVEMAAVAGRIEHYSLQDASLLASFLTCRTAVLAHHRAADALDRQVDFSQLIFNSTDAHLAIVDATGEILAVNTAWRQFALANGAGEERTWGCGACYFRPNPLTGADSHVARQGYEGLRDVQTGRLPHFDLEYACHSPNEQRWFAMRVIPLRDRPATVLVSHTDITSRKLAEQALRESEERYRRLFETMTQGVVYQNPAGHVVSANPAAQHILGFSLDQMLGKTSADPDWGAIREDGSPLPGSEHPSMLALRTGQPVQHFVLGIRNARLGSNRWLTVTAIPLSRPGETTPYQVYTTFEDITSRLQAEAERDRLFMAIEQAYEVIVITDTSGAIQYVNPAFTLLTGYSREEAFGQNPRILRSDTHPPSFYKAMWDTLLRGEAWSGRITNRKKNGDRFIEDAVISPVRDSAGRTVSYVAVKRDVTEEVRLAAELLQAQKMESIGRLAGGVAHDFNNLLTVINGYSDLLLSRLPPEDPLRHSLSEIRKAGRRAAGLTRQLLAFSRKQAAEPRPLHLNELVTDARDMLGRLLGEDVEIIATLDPNPAQVLADPGQLHQVLMNLIVNARDAMPSGGRLDIRTSSLSLDPQAAAAFPGATPGPYAVLEVADNGSGMSDDVRERIFEPFFTTKSSASGGTGLGLSMVHGIVRQASGWIAVESRLGHGTTFRIGLPVLAQAGADPNSAANAPAALHGSETILVVEDQDEVRRLTVSLLRSYGYLTLDASSGPEALRLAESHPGPIHLLLTDVVMPHMSGSDLAVRLKPLRPGAQVLLMSGYPAEAISAETLLHPQAGYLQKPFSPESLARAVRAALDAPSPAARILLADPAASSRHRLEQILATAGYHVQTAGSLAQAALSLASTRFDLLLANLHPGEAPSLPAFRRLYPHLGIIALLPASLGPAPNAASLGADAALLQSVSPARLLESVRLLCSARDRSSSARGSA